MKAVSSKKHLSIHMLEWRANRSTEQRRIKTTKTTIGQFPLFSTLTEMEVGRDTISEKLAV